MASEELAKKLQRRLMLEESTENSNGAILDNNNHIEVGAEEEKPVTSNADTELSAKLTRRLGINEGTTEPKQAKVFNPYTEFKEFTRKQIKEMEKMFKHYSILHIQLACHIFMVFLDLISPLDGYDSGKDGFIDLMELKLMMEKLGAPQTHLGLKDMIKEVDEDFDGKLNFREICSKLGLERKPEYSPSKYLVKIAVESKRFGSRLMCALEERHFGAKRYFLHYCKTNTAVLFLLIFHKAAAGELEEDSGLMALARLSEIDVSTEGVQGAKNFFEAKVQALTTGSKFEAEIKAEQEQRKRMEEEKKQRRAAFKELKAAFQ